MSKDIEQEVAALLALPLPALRDAWRRHHANLIMPNRLPRDLMVRSIAWKLQERANGGMPAHTVRRLDRLAAQLAKSGDLEVEREVRLKPGTRIIRDWHGKTCRVLVLEQGFLFEDRRYASLSHIARAITGVTWSGPRFFGLKQRGRRRPQTNESCDV